MRRHGVRARRGRRLARRGRHLHRARTLVTGHSLAGLAGLNALYLAAGAAGLWLVRGAAGWIEVVRLLGLAYVTGVVVTGSAWTLLLIVGVPFSLGLVIGLPLALAVAFAIAGRLR